MKRILVLIFALMGMSFQGVQAMQLSENQSAEKARILYNKFKTAIFAKSESETITVKLINHNLNLLKSDFETCLENTTDSDKALILDIVRKIALCA